MKINNLKMLAPFALIPFAYSLAAAATITATESSTWDALDDVPTSADTVVVDSNSGNVTLTQTSMGAVAGGIQLWSGDSKTNQSNLKLTNDTFLDLGDGSITTHNLSGELATPSTSAYTQIHLVNDLSGSTYKSKFFNAKSLNVQNVTVATSSAGPVIWQVNRADATYNIAGALDIGGYNTAATGSGVEHSAGTIVVKSVSFASSGLAMELNYTLNGGTLITDNVSTSGSNSTPSSGLKATFTFDGGTIANYSADTLNFSKKVWNTAESFTFGLGSKMTTAESGISHSANVFQTAIGKSINIGGGVYIKSLESNKGGFTVKGGGKMTLWVAATAVTGKVSILENSQIDVMQSTNGTKGDIYIETGSTYNLVKGTSLFTIDAGRTYSGGGKILIAKDFTIKGSLDPMGADAGIGTFHFVASETGTIKLASTASIEIDILSDFSDFDKVDIGANTFAEATTGAGLGKIVFDIAKGSASATHIISAAEIFKQGGSTDWSLAKLESSNSDWSVSYENGNFIFTALVPEPSSLAAIFGALAIAFAFYRRRV